MLLGIQIGEKLFASALNNLANVQAVNEFLYNYLNTNAAIISPVELVLLEFTAPL